MPSADSRSECHLLGVDLLLFVVAAAAGALNSVAGGGSFLTLPTLLFVGVNPVAANATSTLAVWPASVSSTVAYRRDLKVNMRRLVVLGVVSVAGGWIGAVLLVRTSDTSFMRLLPWLMLFAVATFTFGGRIQTVSTVRVLRGSLVFMALLQFVIAIYGGYFGGGMGIMMLATFSLVGMVDIHEMNGLKSLLGIVINGFALAEFVASGTVVWRYGLIMIFGSLIGGYVGATLARTSDPKAIRLIVIVIGWTMTIYFFVR